MTGVSKTHIRVKPIAVSYWEVVEDSDNFDIIAFDTIEDWAKDNEGRRKSKRKKAASRNSLSDEQVREALSRIREREKQTAKKIQEKNARRERYRRERYEQVQKARFERLIKASKETSENRKKGENPAKRRSYIKRIVESKNDLLKSDL